MEANGVAFRYEDMVAPPPDELKTAADIAAFGDAVRTRFLSWWAENADSDFSPTIQVYFGETTRHEMFERVVWHSTQHVRQVTALLEEVGVTPQRPLTPAHIEGLPLTDKVWD